MENMREPLPESVMGIKRTARRSTTVLSVSTKVTLGRTFEANECGETTTLQLSKRQVFEWNDEDRTPVIKRSSSSNMGGKSLGYQSL